MGEKRDAAGGSRKVLKTTAPVHDLIKQWANHHHTTQGEAIEQAALLLLKSEPILASIADRHIKKRQLEEAHENTTKLMHAMYFPRNALRRIFDTANTDIFMHGQPNMDKIRLIVKEEMETYSHLPLEVMELMHDDVKELQAMQDKGYLVSRLSVKSFTKDVKKWSHHNLASHAEAKRRLIDISLQGGSHDGRGTDDRRRDGETAGTPGEGRMVDDERRPAAGLAKGAEIDDGCIGVCVSSRVPGRGEDPRITPALEGSTPGEGRGNGGGEGMIVPPQYSDIESWYRRRDVKFAMLPYLQLREIGFIVGKGFPEQKASHRHYACMNVQGFDIIRDYSRMERKKTHYNVYTTLATYRKEDLRFPNPESDDDTRKRFLEYWKSHHHSFITGYDLVFDIDGSHEDFPFSKRSMLKVHAYLTAIHCPHAIRFSGKGFHVIVPWKRIAGNVNPVFDPQEEGNIYALFSACARLLFTEASEMIDTSIYDSRRLLKCPWSLALYADCPTMFVCKPLLTEEELRRCELEDFCWHLFKDGSLRSVWTKDIIFEEQGSVEELFRRAQPYLANGDMREVIPDAS